MTAGLDQPTSYRILHRQATKRLTEAGLDTPSLDARLLLEAATGLDHAGFLLRRDEAAPPEAAGVFAGFIERRLAREPVGRILGHRGFWTLELELSPATLEPRPDTERLVEGVLELVADRQAPLTVVDLGTGTGCILLALLSELPNAIGLGLDRSEEAAATARRNAGRNGLSDRAFFAVGDWTQALVPYGFDIIVSNPPYIPSADLTGLDPEVRLFDPQAALDGGPDGLAPYRVLSGAAPTLLRDGGIIGFEVGIGQAQDVAEMLKQQLGDTPIVKNDYQGINRCVLAKH
ncbi:peptide chain release factor N(5)-glutamine methyltransferase [Radicibacter daui]|uniref:peptide chain release factor N(5)-glutamine methyltransferase n=1 Tax=Radicibacter daui TaxID=3064829 RepID=UPI004046BA8A